MNNTSIHDNYKNGKVSQFLIENIKPNATLSIVSAYFTIFAYQKLKQSLDQIEHLNFLFGEPTFIKALDPDKTNNRDYKIEDDKIKIKVIRINPNFKGVEFDQFKIDKYL